LRGENFGLVEELASFATQMPAGEDERLKERDRFQVVDFHVASDGEDIERAIDFAHPLVEHSGNNTAVNVSGRTFVKPVQLKVRGGYRVARIFCIRGEDEMKSLRIFGPASEAVIGSLIDGRGAIHRDGGVAGCICLVHP